MNTASQIALVIIAVIHFYFLTLEMFLWTKPLGLKTFRLSREDAERTRALAANQGLYNGFLAAGLLASAFHSNVEVAGAGAQFFLGCVILAGAYGAATVNRRILLVQALPAAIALAVVLM